VVQRQIAEKLLIHTKFNRPRVGEGWIPRPRLTSRLENGLDKRLTLISAPAGFGKTTVAVQWLDQCPRPSAWLSLESDESDPECFLRYVVAAIQLVAPEFGVRMTSLLTAVQLPPPMVLAEAMISDLSVLDASIALVLDDYHLVVSQAVQDMMIRILTHLPEDVHLVFLTRVDPPWPLARWRSQEWVNELRAADLIFSEEETGTFFGNHQFPPDIVSSLQEQTEGWAVGLQLVKLSLSDVDDPHQHARAISGKDRLIVDYLLEEVIARQPRDMLVFLAVSALLDRFCAPLCDFLLADTPNMRESRTLIERLEKENLFVVPLDRERLWYRYHHLFRSLLIDHLRERPTPEGKAQFHKRAGVWFADQGLIEEAIEHFIAAEDVDKAAALIESNLHDIIDKDLSRRALKRLLAMFPEEVQNQHPGLLVARVYVMIFCWDFTGIAECLDQAERLLNDTSIELSEARRRGLRADIDAQRGFLHFWQGEAELALEHAGRAVHSVPAKHGYARALAVVYAAGAHANLGRREEALDSLAEAIVEGLSARSEDVGGFYVAQMVIRYYAGRFQDAQDSALQMLAAQESFPISDYWIGYAVHFLGLLAYERNLLDAAEEHFGRVEQMRYRVNTRLYHDSLLGLALVAWARGQEDRARQYAAEARRFVIEMNDPYSLRISDSFDLRLALRAGHVPAGPPTVPSTVDSNRFWLEVPSLTHAEYLVQEAAAADSEAALQYVEEALRKARNHHNTPQVIQFLAVKAIAVYRTANLNGAAEVLEEALRIAEPLGFVRTLVDRALPMAELLKAFLKTRPLERYPRLLLDVFAAVPASGESTSASPEGEIRSRIQRAAEEAMLDGLLSNREIDVLLLLEERLTSKEIAERLFISSETVKRHTVNIYRKLNVHGRRQAVSAARAMGLLPS